MLLNVNNNNLAKIEVIHQYFLQVMQPRLKFIDKLFHE